MAFPDGGTRADARLALAGEARACPVIYGKPFHNQALAMFLGFFPDGAAATLALSALAGTLTVALAFVMGNALYGGLAGLLSALMLAISPYHLMYSREGLSDALAVLCWTGSLLLLLRAGTFTAVLSGIAGGLCVGANYRDLILVPLALLLVLRPSLSLRAGLRAFVPWLAGFAATLFAYQLPWFLWLMLSGGGEGMFPSGTYWGQLLTLLGFHGSQGFQFGGWLAFPWYVKNWEGIVALLWLLAVLPFQFRRWSGNDGFLNLAVIVPWFFFSAYWDNASRFFTMLLPFIAVMKSRWLLEGLGRLAQVRGLAVAGGAGLALVLWGLPAALGVAGRSAPYASAAAFLAEKGAPVHVSSNPRIGEALLGAGTASPFPPAMPRAFSVGGKPARYAVTDLQVLFAGYDRVRERYETARRVATTRKIALEVPYDPAGVMQFMMEQDMEFGAARAFARDVAKSAPTLKVFDLGGGGAVVKPAKKSRATKATKKKSSRKRRK